MNDDALQRKKKKNFIKVTLICDLCKRSAFPYLFDESKNISIFIFLNVETFGRLGRHASAASRRNISALKPHAR